MNIFATVLTYTAPSANYRGESAENRAVIQKITRGRFEYPIISPEAIRNALRETMRDLGLPCNRERLHDEEQLAVKFKHYPDEKRYSDDFFLGWAIATKNRTKEKEKLIMDTSDPRGKDVKPELNEIDDKLKSLGEENEDKKEKKRLTSQRNKLINAFPMTFKRDSLFRVNMAVALEPYRYDNVFTQSPLHVDSPWKNAEKSQLLLREVTYTPYQYPFALNLAECEVKKNENLAECEEKREWTKILLKAISQLNGVAGNHARSYFEMAPASIVVRLTPTLVAGYETYGFKIKEDGKHQFPEIVEGILEDDYPGKEFFIGGRIVKDVDEDMRKKLESKDATLDRNPQKLLKTVCGKMFNSTGA